LANIDLPIGTLQARDSVMLDVVTSEFDLSPEQVRTEIRFLHSSTVAKLAAEGIDYRELRNALTPQRDRVERAFLFDTDRIESGSYGYSVGKTLLPLLPRELSCSMLHGDLIIDRDLQDRGVELLNNHAEMVRPVELGLTNQIYCVYINNLTPNMAIGLTDALRDYEPFVGHVDSTTSSSMKDWLSITLVDCYLKHKRVMLNGHEDDAPEGENYNMRGWPLEESGYGCRSIADMYFHLLLGYKIERRVVADSEGDTDFALTAISGRPLPLAEFSIEVDKAKGQYLRECHGASLARAGLLHLSDRELAVRIKRKINNSYIYNLRYDAEHDTSLFNIILELGGNSEEKEAKMTRLLASLEYMPEKRVLRLVTLY
jgi:hypothetical protein